MPEDDKALPKDSDSDFSLPGRFEESNTDYFAEPFTPKPKNKVIMAIAVAFVIVSAGAFSYYFINQDEIDSKIIQNTFNADPERNLVNQYGVGEYGSDHVHAAIAVFVDGKPINFGLQQFQLTSRYIHFENHNSYIIHKHATGAPLDMLFASFGVKITSECIVLNYESDDKAGKFCYGGDQSLMFYVNGVQYNSDISQYEIAHGDRILVSFGDGDSISGQLAYLESLQIPDPPKKTPQFSPNEINV